MTPSADEPRDATDFGGRFLESGGEPIEHDGQVVQLAWVLGPVPGGVLTVRMRAKGDLEQGVGVSADGGWLTVAGEKTKECALWTSTAPECIEILAKPMRGRAAMTVRVWNIWKHPTWGSRMSGTASAGLIVEPVGDTATRLHASAGPGGPAFDDLVVDVEFVPG